MANILNLLILGKTGAGKSSLVNYICDKKVASVSAGGIGSKESIERYEYKYDQTSINLYDTKGIEELELSEKPRLALFELSKEKAGFDMIIYCINTGVKKVSTKEIKKILEIRRNNKNLILVITADDITKGNDNNVFNQMHVIGFTDGEIIKVNSENKVYITGEKSISYGKEDFFHAIRKKVSNKIFTSIEKEITVNVSRKATTWKLRCKNELNSNKKLFISKDKRRTETELVDDFNQYLKEVENSLNEEIKDILMKMYLKYKILYGEDTKEALEKININSGLYLPDKNKRTYNFAVLDKVEKQLEKYWLDEVENIIKEIGK